MTDHLLQLEGLAVRFEARPGLRGGRGGVVRAVDGVDLTLQRGELLALVGESGSGKTTTAHAALRLVVPSEGVVRLEGRDVSAVPARELRKLRRGMALIYQDPYESLDPRYSVRRVIEEPLRIHGLAGSSQDRRRLVAEALERVGLSPAEGYLDRLPHELSGGQRQRVSIAAALVLDPVLLVADEPVSMLDVSVRAGILELLDRLRESGLGILMITHDLSTAAHYADRVAVMYLGRIVEVGPSRQVIEDPRHPYTKALLSVVPQPGRAGRRRTILTGEMPDATAIPAGCRFHPRCPVAIPQCRSEDALLHLVGGAAPGHQVACHLPDRTDTGDRNPTTDGRT